MSDVGQSPWELFVLTNASGHQQGVYVRGKSRREREERRARTGGFVDEPGWRGVYEHLKKDGYNVTIVQNPTTSLADDVAVTKRALATQNGSSILVGHSYGASSSQKPATIRRSRASSISQHLLRTRASSCPR